MKPLFKHGNRYLHEQAIKFCIDTQVATAVAMLQLLAPHVSTQEREYYTHEVDHLIWLRNSLLDTMGLDRGPAPQRRRKM